MFFPPIQPWRIVACLASAILVCLSFPNFLELSLNPSTAFLGWIALIPLFLALSGREPKESALLAWIFGLAKFGGILYWIGLIEAAKTLSWLGWFALVLYLSLYPLVFGLLRSLLGRRWGSEPWLSAILWVGLEYIRGSRPWGGFSWGELGYSQAPYPVVLTLTEWGGIYGLTFFMVYFNASLAKGLSGFHIKNKKRNWAPILWPAAALMLVLIWGRLEIDRTAFERKGTAVMLQPSIPQEEKWSRDNEKATLGKLETLVKEASGLRPDLILWPETAAPDYLSWSSDALKSVERIVRSSHTNHLVGCLDAEKGLHDPKTHSFNAAMSFAPDGRPGGTYHKRHLVPFGEFVPFQKYLRFLGPVVGDLGNFDRGERYESFRANGFTYTPLICYEVIFPGDVEEALRNGAEVIVNISNDAWYGKTASAYQHAQMALVRAAEHHRPLLRCSNAGLCLATDPFGRVLGSTRLFDVRYLGVEVLTMKDATTFYSRFGNWIPILCVFLIIVLTLLSWFLKPGTEG